MTPQNDADIGYASAAELARLYQRRALSPSEAVAAILRRIGAVNPRVNAFSVVMEDEALTAAARADSRVASGAARPLEGIPVTIKDFYEVEGQESETGSHAIRRPVALRDNPVVKRLRDAGAIILGKTTMSEFAWSGISRNPVTGVTHNPWGQGLNAGASSAGAGAAAAAGFGPLHLGSDGAGSIRMPAHFCGIYGLKPTYGRVPHIPVSSSDNGTYIGPMTRSVEDAALMLKLMAGPHHLDHTCCEAPPEDYPAQLSRAFAGARIAFSPDLGHARVDPEIARIVENAVDLLARGTGAEIVRVAPPWGPKGHELGRIFWSALQGRNAHLLDRGDAPIGDDLAACMRHGARFGAPEYLRARERKSAYIAEISESFEDWDFLVTPVASVAAFPVERVLPDHWEQHPWDWLSWAEFLYPFNMSGNPAASIPCGFTAAGLPVGLQIVGRRFDDLGTLQLSMAFERLAGLSAARPALELSA